MKCLSIASSVGVVAMVVMLFTWLPGSAHAATSITWFSEIPDPDTGVLTRGPTITISTTSPTTLPLNVSGRMRVTSAGRSIRAELFYLPDPNTSEREPVAISLRAHLSFPHTWMKEGVYEIDVYQSGGVQEFRGPTQRFVAWLFGETALAQTDPFFIETMRFTIVAEESEPSCCSSVLFLPGIMGSRLYKGGEKLWEPTDDEDVQALYFDEEGKSLHSIVVGDTIQTFDGPGSADPDIYRSFLEDLAGKKAENVINDYASFPYDWRLSVQDILADGALEQILRDLAADSKTGKVAIIAHSNGGLVAKALLAGLAEEAPTLVDQLMLVGVPQVGTPQAAGALLHGFDSGLPFDWLPFILSPERARDLGKNAPLMYQLLPHLNYYASVGATISSPIITFKPGIHTALYIIAYGQSTETIEELNRFLVGEEGRPESQYHDLGSPARGNQTLLNNAASSLPTLDSWTPPQGILVHQIAGVGEDTLSGITYSSGRGCVRAVITPLPIIGTKLFCLEYGDKLLYTPDFVLDGDGTVVTPSALAMSTSSDQVRRWWFNLDQYNENNLGIILDSIVAFHSQHKDLTEIPPSRTFLTNILSESVDALPSYISSSTPDLGSQHRLRFFLHSPLILSAIGVNGTEYPAVRYGEVQVLTLPANISPILKLHGVEGGSFTLEIHELMGDARIATTTFSGIPNTASTTATLVFPDGTIAHAGNLEIDYDGNGTIDLTLSPKKGETVTLPEPTPLEILGIIKEKVRSLKISNFTKNLVIKAIGLIELKIKYNDYLDRPENSHSKQSLTQSLKDLLFVIIDIESKGKITLEDVQKILEVLKKVERVI